MRKQRISSCRRYLKYIVLTLLFYPLSVLGAQGQVSVKGQSITIKQAIQLIEKNSSYTFFYNAADLKNTKTRNINCSGTINEVLNEVFKGSGVSYTIKGNEVILKVEGESTQQAAKHKIIGVVTESATGDPIPGASVMIKGTKTGTTTDVDGKFEVMATSSDVLVISFIGYSSKEIKVGNQKVLSVTLSDDAEQLDEVVVTAFGTGQKKETVTGSIQSVRPADLKVPTANLSTAFAGRLSGVISYQRSGEPGNNGADFFIRGVATMNSATPLIVLDGVEISKADLNALDPEVIESFSVLKDATASAMYGTRGANGVLIIKTKSGSDLEKPIIGVRVEAYVNTPIKRPKTVDGVTFMRMYNEAVTNQGTGDALYSDDKIYGTANNLNPYIYPNVDWYDEVFKNATFNQKANFNVRGGTSKITYFMNVNVNHETGMLKDRSSNFFSYKNNIDYMKYAFQNNVDFHMSKTSTLSLHLNVQLNNMHGPLTTSEGAGVDNIFGAIMGTNPVDFPVMYPQEDEKWYRWGSIVAGNYNPVNPVAVSSMGYKDTFESTVVANLDFDQKLDFITKGLSFKALISFKNWSYNSKYRLQGYNTYQLTDYTKNEDGTYNYTVNSIGDATNHTLDSFFGTDGDRRFYIQGYFNYDRAFGDHHVGGMLLYNQDEYNSNFNSSLLNSLPKRRMGIAVRAAYDYANRYLFEFNAGYNGSENFAKGHRFGFFPSVSVGWNISEESFFEPLRKVITSMKLRGSWGLVGNDQIGGERFIYMPTINLSGKGFTTGIDQNYGLSGPVYTRYENNSITWEVGEKINLGIDLQLLNSLNIVVDIFRETRRDIFQKKGTIPTYLGTGNTDVFGNLAEMKNQGLDLSIDYNKAFSKDFYMNFKGTFTYAHNEITKYDEAPKYAFQSKVGQSANVSQGYLSNGLFLDEAEIDRYNQQMGSTLGAGDIKYLNVSNMHGYGDDIVDVDDWTWIGNPTVPEIVYGFGPSFKYKNWDFSFFFQGVAKTSLFMSGFHPFGDNSLRNVLQFVANDRWSPTNQNVDAKYPRLTRKTSLNNTNPGNSGRTSDYWMRDGSFLKLKNMELGYTFKRMRFYISGSNLLTFSKFDLWDPEQGGGSGLKYPTQRVFNVGFQMTFNN